jgi:hypothetical protein
LGHVQEEKAKHQESVDKVMSLIVQEELIILKSLQDVPDFLQDCFQPVLVVIVNLLVVVKAEYFSITHFWHGFSGETHLICSIPLFFHLTNLCPGTVFSSP